MHSSDLRKGFLDYFGQREHTLVPSAPLIPQKDPTLLFTNAGMVQFKELFLGKEDRGYRRAVSAQKCMRAGGKHNDLDNVGITGRHHTFFEMLGNFSFGDYFKADAIAFGWELLTKKWNLPKDRLWITVFRDDDEAEQLWEKIGVPKNHIRRMDEKDNFWAMGDTGPCGPCSEVLIDQGEAAAPEHDCRGVGCDCDRYLEIWNLVFMQFMRDANGRLNPLPRPSIDTGMGLERITAVTNGVPTNYDTDLFQPILKFLADMANQDFEGVRKSVAGRVIADHIRAVAFLIGDGVLPSNEGRGYILRRVIRRAARYGRELGLSQPFLHKLSGSVVDTMRQAYPELARAKLIMAQVTQGEEERFIQTLDQGMGRFKEVLSGAKKTGAQVVSGEEVFRLYDTYGFPVDIAKDMARDVGLKIDEVGYQAAMENQKERARKAWVVKEVAPYYEKAAKELGLTPFVGYDNLTEEIRLIGILKNGRPVKRATTGETVELIFNRTPFYGESGGQAGDQGLLEHPRALAEIHTTIKPLPGFHVHQGRVVQGEIVEGETYRAVVSSAARQGASRNHTATHVLHATLREVLGEHVKQSGSMVTPDRLRFDFGHFKSLTPKEVKEVESQVSAHLRENVPVETEVMNFQEAVRSGALAFFDDKYGDQVRVVRMSDFSRELCGGTHCRETGQVGLFKLIQEGSVAAGVRRIEALTGGMAYRFVEKQEEDLQAMAVMLKVQPAEVVERTRRLIAQVRDKDRELEKLKSKAAGGRVKELLTEARSVKGIQLLAKRLDDGLGPKDLRAFSDKLRGQLKSNFISVLASVSADDRNAVIIVTVSSDLATSFHAGEIAKGVAAVIGGSGGGRQDMAQAGGRDIQKLKEALAEVFRMVEKKRS